MLNILHLELSGVSFSTLATTCHPLNTVPYGSRGLILLWAPFMSLLSSNHSPFLSVTIPNDQDDKSKIDC